MDVIRLSQLISTTNLRSYRDDDFWVDRLSHRYSVVIFTTFAVLVTTKAYIGDPIDCWAPPEFKASYERYAETLCFVNGTYYISSTEIDIPSEPGERYSNRVRYYQWTPFILLLQAFFMYLPRVIWLSLNTKYGIHLRNLVDAAKKFESVDSCSNREKIIAYLCRNLLRSVKYREYKANKKVLNAIKRDMYMNHQLELDSLLKLMSAQPTLTANILAREHEAGKKCWSKQQQRGRIKSSRSYDDLNSSSNNQESSNNSKHNKSNNNHQSKHNNNNNNKQQQQLNEFYSKNDPSNECRLKLVSFRTSPENTAFRACSNQLTHHRSKSSRSESNHNLSQQQQQQQHAVFNPTYFIIDPNLDTSSLLDYLNTSLVDNTRFHLDSPLNLLQAKITNVSRKHLLGMLTSSCYEVDEFNHDDNHDHDDGTCPHFHHHHHLRHHGGLNHEKKDKTSQVAYLINSEVVRHLDHSVRDSASMSRRRSLYEMESKKREQQQHWGSTRCAMFNLSDKYLYSLYVVVKACYLLSALSQLVFLNRLIGNNFYILGVTLIKTFFKEIEWPHLDVFPRMTLCEIYIREVGTTHPYLIQCVLRINLFNEIIFVCVWYWLLFVICVTALDLVRHLLTLFLTCSSCNRKLFALKYLELVHLNASFNQLAAKRFAAKLRAKKKVNLDTLLLAKEKAAAAAAAAVAAAATTTAPASVPNASASPNPGRNQYSSSQAESRESIYYDNNMFLKVDNNNNNNNSNHNKSHMNVRPGSTCSSIDGEFNYEARHSNRGSNGGGGGGVSSSSPSSPSSSSSSSSKQLLNYLNHKYMLIVANEDEQFELFERFCNDNFNNDTIFSLRVIEQNVSSLIVSEIIEHMWTQYKALHCVYSTDTNDYLLKKLFVFNDLRRHAPALSTATATATLPHNIATRKESKVKKHSMSKTSLVEKL